jgi:hypothetical protein
MKILILTILSFVIVSCGGSSSSAPVENTATNSSVTTGTLYNKALHIQKDYSLGYDLSYSCTGNTCSLSGELHHFYPGFDQLKRTQIIKAELTLSGEYHVGTMTTTSGQTFNVSLKMNQNFMKIDNGVNCTKTNSPTTQSGYDALVASYPISSGSLVFTALTPGQCNL